MGKLPNGIFGPVRGRIGDLVAYQLNGETVVRTIGRSNKPPTTAQLTARQRLSVISVFLPKILEFLSLGFAALAEEKGKQPYPLALSANLMAATSGIYPSVVLDWNKLILSVGNLAPALDPEMEIRPDGILLRWSVQPGLQRQALDDRSMLMLHFPAQQQTFQFLNAAQRSERMQLLEIPAAYLWERPVAYISFMSYNRKNVSPSVFVP